MKIDSVLKQYPQALPILLRHRVRCAGCYISGFHDLATVSHQYNVELESLLAELNAAVEGPS
jgi:hybrid cluster-associated redox disulfide protein